MNIKLPPIPPPTVPIMDPKNSGVWDTRWYDYLRSADQSQRAQSSSGTPASPYPGLINIKDAPFNAVGNGVADDYNAIQNALNYLQTTFGGGYVYFPSGNPYLTNSTIVVPASVTLLGSGVGNCSIMARNDVTVLNVVGDYAQVINLTVIGKGSNSDAGSFGATQPAVQMDGVEAKMMHARVQGGAPCIRVTKDDTYLDDVTVIQSYGDAIVKADAVTFMSRCKIDQGYPVSQPPGNTNFANWAATTAYTIGTVVTLIVGPNVWLIQCRIAGTSGGIQPDLKNYDINIPDGGGTLVWRLVARQDTDCLRVDGNEFHAVGPTTDISGVGRYGVLVNGGTLTFLENLIIGQQWFGSIRADNGSSLRINKCELNLGLNSNRSAVEIGSGWTGDLSLTDNTIFGITAGGSIGVDVGGGVDTRIAGNYIKNLATGIITRANVKQFIIDTNSIIGCTRSIDIPATADHYIVTNNLINASGAMSDLGVAPKTVTGNV